MWTAQIHTHTHEFEVLNVELFEYIFSSNHHTSSNIFISQFLIADIKTNYLRYDVIGTLPELDDVVVRNKREVNIDNNKSSIPVSIPSSSSPASAASPSGTATPIASNDTQSITLENNKRLLGVNGTGQRLNITATPSITAPTDNKATPSVSLSAPANANATIAKPSKGWTAIKSMVAPTNATSVVAPTIEATADIDKIIEGVDTAEENINKTIHDKLNVTYKDDYYQYYNSTTLVDQTKSEHYWAELTNFTTSSLLSKSHRRAIVCFLHDNYWIIAVWIILSSFVFRRSNYHLNFPSMDIRCEI